MNYIFCPSYEPLYFVLHLWNSGEKEIKVITYNEGIRKFCNHLGTEVVYFQLPEFVERNPFKKIYQLYKLKKALNVIIENYVITKKDIFYLLSSTISYPGFYLAKKFAEKCAVYFKNISAVDFFELNRVRKYLDKAYLKKRYFGCLVKMVFGIDLIIYHTGIKYVVGINDTFLEKCNINKIPFDKTIQELRIEAIDKTCRMIEEQFDSMVLTGDEWHLDSVLSMQSVKKVYQRLFNIISDYAVKEYPNLIKNKNVHYNEYLPENAKKLPDYIPSELLFKSIKKNVIGLVSATLVSSAKQKHLKAISLLELVEWKKEDTKNYYKNFLTKQSDCINFVRDFEELENIILKN